MCREKLKFKNSFVIDFCKRKKDYRFCVIITFKYEENAQVEV